MPVLLYIVNGLDWLQCLETSYESSCVFCLFSRPTLSIQHPPSAAISIQRPAQSRDVTTRITLPSHPALGTPKQQLHTMAQVKPKKRNRLYALGRNQNGANTQQFWRHYMLCSWVESGSHYNSVLGFPLPPTRKPSLVLAHQWLQQLWHPFWQPTPFLQQPRLVSQHSCFMLRKRRERGKLISHFSVLERKNTLTREIHLNFPQRLFVGF